MARKGRLAWSGVKVPGDGLKGLLQAIETVYPKTMVQLGIVHTVRASLGYVNWKERKLVARARLAGISAKRRRLAFPVSVRETESTPNRRHSGGAC